jgi:hypothetical protein
MAKADGRRADRRGRSKDAPPFVQIPWWVMETPAYHSLTPEARTALLYMTKRYYGHNNGRIGFGVRSGGFVRNHPGQPDAELVDVPVMSSSRMHRALIEVEALGFAVVSKESSFGQKKLTREWRLTWLGSDLAGESKTPTKDFMALSMADCRRIQVGLKTKPSPAGATKSPRTVPLAGQSPSSEGPNMSVQSHGRDYAQSSQSHWRDTSSNHPGGAAETGTTGGERAA